MTPIELASILNGRQCLAEMTWKEIAIARENDLVVAFISPPNDELLLKGAINEGFSTRFGINLEVRDRDVLFASVAQSLRKWGHSFESTKIKVEQNPNSFAGKWCVKVSGSKSFYVVHSDRDYSYTPSHWATPAAVPFETFDGNKPYCRGVVFNVNP